MSTCEICGNNYEYAFTIVMRGRHHVFDSFECAIHALAPRCARCDLRIIGHGVQHEELVYCSAQCARYSGVKGLVDHA